MTAHPAKMTPAEDPRSSALGTAVLNFGRGIFQHAHHVYFFNTSRLRLVNETVSKKGYDIHPVAQGPDMSQSEMRHPATSAMLTAVLVKGFAARRQSQADPICPITCNTHRENGRILRAVAMGFVQQVAPGIQPWLGQSARFSSSEDDGRPQ